MTDNSNTQLVVRAKFNFQQTNEDELSFMKGDVIHVTGVEEGGWWEGTHNGRTGWFPSNYVREIKPSEKPVSPKSGTLKSPPKGFDTTAINKSYYNVPSCLRLPVAKVTGLHQAQLKECLFSATEYLRNRKGIFQRAADCAFNLPAATAD